MNIQLADYLSHHDITLIGDNVLLTAWEVKSVRQLNNAGYDNTTSEKWPTHFIELELSTAMGSANIVWGNGMLGPFMSRHRPK